MSLKERANKLKTDIPAVFLAIKRKETPWYAKALAGIAVAYALSPIDLIPDFIPVLGYLDDVLLLPALVALAVKGIPREVLEQCRVEAAELWRNGKPKMWKYAIPIIIFWLLIILIVVKAIWF
jgi:uncharacterized membrane protein YkvA (DUF1232 family)